MRGFAWTPVARPTCKELEAAPFRLKRKESRLCYELCQGRVKRFFCFLFCGWPPVGAARSAQMFPPSPRGGERRGFGGGASISLVRAGAVGSWLEVAWFRRSAFLQETFPLRQGGNSFHRAICYPYGCQALLGKAGGPHKVTYSSRRRGTSALNLQKTSPA